MFYWNSKNKLQYNLNRISYIFLENAFVNVVRKIAAILPRRQSLWSSEVRRGLLNRTWLRFRHGGKWRYYESTYINFVKNIHSSIFSCDQAALWMVFSVLLSVCPSVRLSHLFEYVPIIIVSSWNFQELPPRTRVRSLQKGQGQRSKAKVTEVTTQLSVSGL